MRQAIYTLCLLLLASNASAFSYATGGCADGCAQGEQWLYTNGNEIDTALDAIETKNTSQDSSISTLTSTFANYLPLGGGTMTGSLTMSSGQGIIVPTGAIVAATGSGIILATGMSATGQIDDNDLAAGAVDGGNGGEIADNSITADDIATGGVAGAEILDDSVVLTTDTAGNYVATIADSGASEVTVTNGSTEGGAVTLAIASTLTRDTELAAKSSASSTDNAIARYDSTAGDLQNSGVTIDDSNNVTVPGNLTAGTSGVGTFILRDTDDAGYSECGVLNGTLSCAIDADGTPDGTL